MDSFELSLPNNNFEETFLDFYFDEEILNHSTINSAANTLIKNLTSKSLLRLQRYFKPADVSTQLVIDKSCESRCDENLNLISANSPTNSSVPHNVLYPSSEITEDNPNEDDRNSVTERQNDTSNSKRKTMKISFISDENSEWSENVQLTNSLSVCSDFSLDKNEIQSDYVLPVFDDEKMRKDSNINMVKEFDDSQFNLPSKALSKPVSEDPSEITNASLVELKYNDKNKPKETVNLMKKKNRKTKHRQITYRNEFCESLFSGKKMAEEQRNCKNYSDNVGSALIDKKDKNKSNISKKNNEENSVMQPSLKRSTSLLSDNIFTKLKKVGIEPTISKDKDKKDNESNNTEKSKQKFTDFSSEFEAKQMNYYNSKYQLKQMGISTITSKMEDESISMQTQLKTTIPVKQIDVEEWKYRTRSFVKPETLLRFPSGSVVKQMTVDKQDDKAVEEENQLNKIDSDAKVNSNTCSNINMVSHNTRSSKQLNIDNLVKQTSMKTTTRFKKQGSSTDKGFQSNQINTVLNVSQLKTQTSDDKIVGENNLLDYSDMELNASMAVSRTASKQMNICNNVSMDLNVLPVVHSSASRQQNISSFHASDTKDSIIISTKELTGMNKFHQQKPIRLAKKVKKHSLESKTLSDTNIQRSLSKEVQVTASTAAAPPIVVQVSQLSAGNNTIQQTTDSNTSNRIILPVTAADGTDTHNLQSYVLPIIQMPTVGGTAQTTPTAVDFGQNAPQLVCFNGSGFSVLPNNGFCVVGYPYQFINVAQLQMTPSLQFSSVDIDDSDGDDVQIVNELDTITK